MRVAPPWNGRPGEAMFGWEGSGACRERVHPKGDGSGRFQGRAVIPGTAMVGSLALKWTFPNVKSPLKGFGYGGS